MNDDPLEPADRQKTIFGYAVYRAWKDNPKNVDVVEYFNTEKDCKEFLKTKKKDERFKWGIGAYQ
jgi:predicted CoA-binding protein